MVTVALAPVVPTGCERLTPVERARVAVEILGTYVAARRWMAQLRVVDAATAARTVVATPHAAADAPTQFAAAVRLGRAVERTLRPLPVDASCLVKALVLTRMLARRQIECSLVLGVRTRPAFAAHAWVESGGIALLATTPDFQPIVVA